MWWLILAAAGATEPPAGPPALVAREVLAPGQFVFEDALKAVPPPPGVEPYPHAASELGAALYATYPGEFLRPERVAPTSSGGSPGVLIEPGRRLVSHPLPTPLGHLQPGDHLDVVRLTVEGLCLAEANVRIQGVLPVGATAMLTLPQLPAPLVERVYLDLTPASAQRLFAHPDWILLERPVAHDGDPGWPLCGV